MITKNRPQYIQDLVKKTNEYLRANKVKDPYSDSLFIFMCDYLLNKSMYEGYNFYKEIDEYFNPLTGEVTKGESHLVLAGTKYKDNYDCLQIW